MNVGRTALGIIVACCVAACIWVAALAWVAIHFLTKFW